MKVWVVKFYELIGHIGWPEIWGIYTSLEKAKDAVERYAKQHVSQEDIGMYGVGEAVQDFIEDNFEIEEWFTDNEVLRGE